MNTTQQRDMKKGFTLTELVVTIGTIGVLGGMLGTAITKAKHRAKDVQCLNNQRNVRAVLEADYQDVVTDYNLRYDSADILELNDRFNTFCSSSLMKDPYLGELGVFYSKPVTCPYAFGNGTKRSGFSTIFKIEEKNGALQYVPFSSNDNKEVTCITYSYYLSWNFMDTKERNSIDERGDIHLLPIVSDWLNNNKTYTTTVKNMFPQIKNGADRTISFNDSVLHPHKGIGSFATFGNGEQKWVKKE